MSHEHHTKSVEELEIMYEDEKNSMIVITETDEVVYEDFYEEIDNRMKIEHSMNIIFFGPPNSFLRLDTETILHIFVNTKKTYIPIRRAILAWDMVTDGKTSAYLQGRELLAFGNLLNVIPEEDLYYMNFGNPSVHKYFANHHVEISNRKFGILIAAYRRYYGNTWYKRSGYINDLGYLLCGFPYYELANISPATFRELNLDVLGKLERCNSEQSQTLYQIAIHPDAYGPVYKWSSHEIRRLNSLFICIPSGEISSIQLEAITGITPHVIKLINQSKLSFFTQQQVLRMIPKTRKIYILRMQLQHNLDASFILKNSGGKINPDIYVHNIILYIVTLLLRVAGTNNFKL